MSVSCLGWTKLLPPRTGLSRASTAYRNPRNLSLALDGIGRRKLDGSMTQAGKIRARALADERNVQTLKFVAFTGTAGTCTRIFSTLFSSHFK